MNRASRADRFEVALMWIGAVIVLAAIALAGCGAGARGKAVSMSMHTVDAAEAGFVAWDGDHQQAIVHDASSEELGGEQLAEYRQKRAVVVDGFAAAYRAIAVAALDLKHADLAALAVAVESAISFVKDLEAER